mmetsp:Transcript_12393/g.43140  ORF Transcript_12393/g.43140 Transcript_12393/m.43140 type:complete len:100 (-) Transcript_12393:188-487(-)
MGMYFIVLCYSKLSPPHVPPFCAPRFFLSCLVTSFLLADRLLFNSSVSCPPPPPPISSVSLSRLTTLCCTFRAVTRFISFVVESLNCQNIITMMKPPLD